MDVIARARAQAELGRSRVAIDLLKPLAIAEEPPYAARRALAQVYRDLGAPDQAGRWGIAIDGWTTAFERDRLARALASYVEPRHFLSLPAGAPEPADLAAMLELRAKHGADADVRRRRAADAWERGPEARAARAEEARWIAATVLIAVGAIGPSLAVAIARVMARDAWALVAAGAGWSSIALACIVIAVDRWRKHRRLSVGVAACALAIAGVAIGSFALAAHWGAG